MYEQLEEEQVLTDLHFSASRVLREKRLEDTGSVVFNASMVLQRNIDGKLMNGFANGVAWNLDGGGDESSVVWLWSLVRF